MLGFQIDCQTKQTSQKSSDEKIRNIIINEDFYEGDKIYKKIMSYPKDRLIPILEKLRDDGIEYVEGKPSKLIELKSAYLLCKLNVDYSKNSQFIIDEVDSPPSNEKRDYYKTNAIEYVGELITAEDKKLLPVVFRVTPKSDAGFAQSINSILYFELANSPKPFLKYLSKESEENKNAVIEILSFKIVSEKDLKKVKANLNKLLKDKVFGKNAKEILDKLQ